MAKQRQSLTRLRAKRTLLGLAVGLLALFIVHRVTVRDDPGWSGGIVPAETPESVGISSQKLDLLVESLRSEGTLSFLLIRKDRVVHEWYTRERGPHTKANPASATKALFGSLALAWLVDNGQMSFDSRCANWITEWKNDPQRSQITLRQLAVHTSGLAFGDRDEGGDSAWWEEFWRGPDPYATAIEKAPLLFPPGTRYHYSGPAYAVLGDALTRQLRDSQFRSISELLHARLFEPMGVRRSSWNPGRKRVVQRADHVLEPIWSDISCTPRTAALIGRLIMRRGNWDGRQLLSADVVDALIQPDPVAEERQEGEPVRPGVAMGWWSNQNGFFKRVPKDALIAAGSGHQIVLLLPSHDLIAMRYGRPLGGVKWSGPFWRALEQHLLDPLMDVLQAERASGSRD